MGRIQRRQRRHWLAATNDIGRGPANDVSLDSDLSSSIHAKLSWSGRAWRLADLGSRNGTWTHASPITAAVEISAGDSMSFGCAEETWTLVDDGPPRAFARAAEREIVAVDEIIALPDEHDPELCIYGDGDGGWRIEREHGTQPARDRQTLEAGGLRWTLRLPPRFARTTVDAVVPPRLEDLRLCLRHSLHEEQVQASLLGGPRRVALDLGARAHHTVALALARVMLEDRAAELPEAEQGWVHREDLATRLGLDVSHINVLIWRLRRQLAALEIRDFADIVERRHLSGELRLGVTNVDVAEL